MARHAILSWYASEAVAFLAFWASLAGSLTEPSRMYQDQTWSAPRRKFDTGDIWVPAPRCSFVSGVEGSMSQAGRGSRITLRSGFGKSCSHVRGQGAPRQAFGPLLLRGGDGAHGEVCSGAQYQRCGWRGNKQIRLDSDREDKGIKKTRRSSVLLTTAIAYTNAAPHMGHAYEIVTADMVARFNRAMGRDVFFSTGSDEYGQKIAGAAAAMGRDPLSHCDVYVRAFKDVYAKLGVSYDAYIRTTSAEHRRVAQALFRRAQQAGDIYLGTYTGWYDVRQEAFISETEAALNNYSDPETGKPLERLEEPSYFFRLGNYQEKIRRHIDTHPHFVQPAFARNDILERLEEPLRDLSISRTSFEWGVQVPSDPKHVLYVWFDALCNYLSGCGWTREGAGRWWPAGTHLIGKDIVWFHSVIWPAMLLSAGVELPAQVFAHGFVNDHQGRKMSKSLGNVQDLPELLTQCPSDTLRVYLASTVPFGSDLPFSRAAMVSAHNSLLADGIGNLARRCLSLCEKFCGAEVPSRRHPDLPFDFREAVQCMDEEFASLALHRAAEVVLGAVRATNKWLYRREPWKLKDPADQPLKAAIIATGLEAVLLLAHLFQPFAPDAAAALLQSLSVPATPLTALSPAYDNIPPGTRVATGSILFQKLPAPDES